MASKSLFPQRVYLYLLVMINPSKPLIELAEYFLNSYFFVVIPIHLLVFTQYSYQSHVLQNNNIEQVAVMHMMGCINGRVPTPPPKKMT